MCGGKRLTVADKDAASKLSATRSGISLPPRMCRMSVSAARSRATPSQVTGTKSAGGPTTGAEEARGRSGGAGEVEARDGAESAETRVMSSSRRSSLRLSWRDGKSSGLSLRGQGGERQRVLRSAARPREGGPKGEEERDGEERERGRGRTSTATPGTSSCPTRPASAQDWRQLSCADGETSARGRARRGGRTLSWHPSHAGPVKLHTLLRVRHWRHATVPRPGTAGRGEAPLERARGDPARFERALAAFGA